MPASLQLTDAAPLRIDAGVSISGDHQAAEEFARLCDALKVATDLSDEGPSVHFALAKNRQPESYHIVVDSGGALVTGADAAGLFYGAQTLAQLIEPARIEEGPVTIPAVSIDDAPRFPYRGVMLDIVRHFHSVTTIRAFIDRAAGLKCNTLHLHLTDDQAWRLRLTSHPALALNTADGGIGGAAGYLTADDFSEIVSYAASRHMTVVPEIDLPGHTHAVSLTYPDLCEEPVLSPSILSELAGQGAASPELGTHYRGQVVGFSSLKIGEEATYAFLHEVLAELAELTPGPYLHVGGDETYGTDPADYDRFMSRVTAMVHSLGKIPMAWHDAGKATDLAPTTVGQYWGMATASEADRDAAATFADGSRHLVVSPADTAYLDMKFDALSRLGLLWANGVTSLERAYRWEPTELIGNLQEADVLGVEAPLWTETAASLSDIDQLAFPRIAAIAEIAWSPRPDTSAERCWSSFRSRVARLSRLWDALEIDYAPIDGVDWPTR